MDDQGILKKEKQNFTKHFLMQLLIKQYLPNHFTRQLESNSLETIFTLIIRFQRISLHMKLVPIFIASGHQGIIK